MILAKKKKNREEQYLALKWVERLGKDFKIVFGDKISAEQLNVISRKTATEDDLRKVFEQAPILNNAFQAVVQMNDPKMLDEYIRDIDAISLTMLWAKNKQVFAFDEDFLNELISTETITMSENAWDYLPYDVFYIDISSNKELCDKVIGKGFFISVEKSVIDNGKSYYYIHCCKVIDNLYFTDINAVENRTKDISADDMILGGNKVPVLEFNNPNYWKDKPDIKQSEMTIDGLTYQKLLIQLLSYLSSIEPDIKENEITKKTYRKPADNNTPKNKFSEIRKWDIGVRYGNAFRKWKKEKTERNVSGEHSYKGHTGTKQRPHSRKAHWSHYWYGHGENKTRRPKWVSAYYVGLNVDDTPTTIHKVTKESEVN